MNSLDIDLNDLYLFVQVVDRKGFTAAGEVLGIPKSRLSRRITELEVRLGTRLLHRTSRKLSVTDAGQVLYVHCTAMIKQAIAGRDAVAERQSEPAGTVRINVPVGIADVVLGKLLPPFTQKYPKVTLNVQVTNHHIDLIAEKVDLVIRDTAAVTESSSMIQMNLCAAEWYMMASPAYLKRVGGIDTLESLSSADALLYAPLNSTEQILRLTGPDNDSLNIPTMIPIPIKIKLQSDHLALLKQMCVAGIGVAGMPLYACKAELDSGQLEIVLPTYHPKTGHIVIILPTRSGLAPAVRALLDFLKVELAAAL